MNTENSDAINDTDDLDVFSADFFGSNPNEPEPVKTEAPDADADDTSPSNADDTNDQDEPEADSDSNEEDEDLLEEEVVEKPKKKTAQERISEVVGERNAARAALEELRAQLEELKAPKQAEKKEETPSVAPTGAPDPNAVDENGESIYPLGEYDAKFLEDRVNWLFANKEAEQELKRAEQEAASRQQAALTALQTDWQTKLDAAAKTEEMASIREKGAEMLQELDSILDEAHGDFLGKTIMGMEKGVEVFNFLANNIDVAKNIATLDGVNAIIALGGIQERVSKRDGNIVNTRISKAPEPPKTTSRGSNSRFETPDDTEDLDAFSDKFFVKRR